jgi:hypothetical protein
MEADMVALILAAAAMVAATVTALAILRAA